MIKVTDMDPQREFESLKSSWQPEPDDNPDNHWFYSSYFALKSMAERKGIDPSKVEHIVHQVCCLSRGEWSFIPTLLASLIPSVYPEKPSYSYSSDCEPTYREERPREIFNRQFKQRFPDKRLNSKFAREKWEEVRDKAKEIVQAEYQG